MIKDHQFLSDLEDENRRFSGWDFSFITETGRMQTGLLSWSYGSIARKLMKSSDSMLDMGTGGGEFLSMLRPFPRSVVATEGYKPNLQIAKHRLESLGVKVVPIEEDNCLPLEDIQFDLILNKHESYSAKEVRRIIRKDGIFLTQQVGGLNSLGINKALGAPVNHEYEHWNLTTALSELEKNHFDVLSSYEAFPTQRFYDIGALVYYLKAIPWQVPGFNVKQYEDELFHIHTKIQSEGFFDVREHRFIIQARAV